MITILITIGKVALVTLPIVWGICLLTADQDRARFYLKRTLRIKRKNRCLWCRRLGSAFLAIGLTAGAYFMFGFPVNMIAMP